MKNLILILTLCFFPNKFIEIATEDVIQKEFMTNQQLLEGYPDKKLPDERRLEFYNQMKKSSLKLRSSIIRSFFSLLITVISAFVAVKVIKATGFIVSPEVVGAVRLLSICMIFWSVWGKLGWDIQTINGETLPEMINANWAKTLYLVGVFMAIFSYFL